LGFDNKTSFLKAFCPQAELKRLYTQLEVLRNKTIRADNPHISKRRGGRKVAHRRFSLQVINEFSLRANITANLCRQDVNRCRIYAGRM
jgi:hypothetical protein